VSEGEAAASLDRTLAWARRARVRQRSGRTQLFGIAQGSTYPRLRERAIEALGALDFDGYALGGLAVGEPADSTREMVAAFAPALPEAKPRYLMGLGTPADLFHGVRHGVDLFDCVLPARNARHGLLYTRAGELRIKNAAYRSDDRPLDDACSCPACRKVPRALLHHLMKSGEITGLVLATLHNVRFFLDFMGDLRQAVASGALDASAARLAYGRSLAPGCGHAPDPGGQASVDEDPARQSPLDVHPVPSLRRPEG
jgi:queuine tRNA-ribosyltransferase